jgi:hypothetical protein
MSRCSFILSFNCHKLRGVKFFIRQITQFRFFHFLGLSPTRKKGYLRTWEMMQYKEVINYNAASIFL